ncbi:hypothetical protein [Bernardetia sp.]|uniref:hypothetical protein n=1 Tax=Bernardetia sp. TaxID=1937974 RepID=UPI0025C09BF7|nr:hypothetical protein [Bernardetia sp.]
MTSFKKQYALLLILFFYLTLSPNIFAQSDTKDNSSSKKETKNQYEKYKNRVSINLLGFTRANVVASYERAFRSHAVWLGANYHINGLYSNEDRNMFSLAAEYRYYFFARRNQKFSDGLFAGVYSKYRQGNEIQTSFTNSGVGEVSHEYESYFVGLNTGYRYNYNRLAVSGFLGYGFLISGSEEGTSEYINFQGTKKELNAGYKNDLRLGITLGFAF